MAKMKKYEYALIVGENDIFIEEDECFTKVNVYEDDDGDYCFRVITPDGIQRFSLTKKIAKELVEQLNQRLEK